MKSGRNGRSDIYLYFADSCKPFHLGYTLNSLGLDNLKKAVNAACGNTEPRLEVYKRAINKPKRNGVCVSTSQLNHIFLSSLSFFPKGDAPQIRHLPDNRYICFFSNFVCSPPFSSITSPGDLELKLLTMQILPVLLQPPFFVPL